MRRLCFRIAPSPLCMFFDWRIYRDKVPESLANILGGFRIRVEDLQIEDCTIFSGDELGDYINERKEKFVTALSECWNNDESEFTIDL